MKVAMVPIRPFLGRSPVAGERAGLSCPGGDQRGRSAAVGESPPGPGCLWEECAAGATADGQKGPQEQQGEAAPGHLQGCRAPSSELRIPEEPAVGPEPPPPRA